MALDVTYYSNVGNSMDLSLSVSIGAFVFFSKILLIYLRLKLILEHFCFPLDYGAGALPYGQLL